MDRPLVVRLAAYEAALPGMYALNVQVSRELAGTTKHRSARRNEKLVALLQERHPALSHPQIGKLIGVEQSTVARIAKRNRNANIDAER